MTAATRPQSPATFSAARVARVDGPFELVELPLAAPLAGQALVRIRAAGVSPLDTKIRAGKGAHARQPLPAVLGMDLAGEVVAVGPGVTRLAVGDEVYGLAGGIGGLQGTLAQYTAVDADLLARKPRTLSMREAAALPLNAITAWEGLVDRANVRAGQHVLVHGGAGGVGHVAVQLARARGAEVVATASAADLDLVRGYGATAVDYVGATPEDLVRAHAGGADGFDVVFDTVGGATLDASFLAARRYTGHVVSALGWGTHALAPPSFRGATYSGVFTLLPMITGEGRAHHGGILEAVAAIVDAGALRPRAAPARFGLADAEAAHALAASGRAGGKVVVEIA